MNQIRAYRFWPKRSRREGQKVDDANGLCSVLELVADMAAIPKTIGAVSDWREHDPLLTPEQVAKRLNTSLDWVWDHSRRTPLLPVTRFGDGLGGKESSAIGTRLRRGIAHFRRSDPQQKTSCFRWCDVT
jgi:hypothetical protein